MDDPRDERSASNIFSELIRQQGALEARWDAAGADDERARSSPPAAEAPREEPAEQDVSEEVSVPEAASGAGNAGAAPPPHEPVAGAHGSAGFFGGMLRALLILPLVALLSATVAIFAISWQQNQAQQMGFGAALPTEAPTPTIAVTPRHMRRIGIVAGHRGVYNDPGAVCDDGLTEREVNEVVAEKVVLHLRGLGYRAELLDEFDSRLNDYQATALVSLHANDCRDYGEHVTGYLIARAAARAAGGPDDLLVKCVGENYQQATGLRIRAGVTSDMSEYHSFVEIHPLTPAVILEMGFLRGDRAVLTEQSDRVARGVYDGILCFLNAIGST